MTLIELIATDFFGRGHIQYVVSRESIAEETAV
jgi:hypothetical protein